MRGVSHGSLGLVGLGIVMATASAETRGHALANSLAATIALLACTLAGSLAPDIDSSSSLAAKGAGAALDPLSAAGQLARLFGLRHRGPLTHSLLAALITTILVGVATHGDYRAVGWGLGYILHLLADVITVDGAPLLWPLWRAPLKLPWPLAIHSGGSAERIIVIGAWVGLGIIWLLKLTLP